MAWQALQQKTAFVRGTEDSIQASCREEPLLKVNGVEVLVDGKQYAQHTDGNSTHGGQAISNQGMVYRQW